MITRLRRAPSLRLLPLIVVALEGTACRPSEPALSPSPNRVDGPVAAAAHGAAPAGEQPLSIVARPDSVLVIYDPTTHRLAAWSPKAVEVWRLALPPGEKVIGLPVAAADSTVYLRVTNEVLAVSADGKLVWQTTMPPAVGDPSIYSPAALTNSGVVLAKTAVQLVAYDPRGVEMWQFNLPLNEELRTSPLVADNGAICVATAGGLAAVSPAGVLNWYRQRTPVVSGSAPTP